MFRKILILLFLNVCVKGSNKPLSSIETLQFVNNTSKPNYKKPLKVFVFLVRNNEFLDELKKQSKEDLLSIVRDMESYAYVNRFFLLTKPEALDITSGEVSRKLLIYYNRQALMGIAILVVSFDGSYITTCFIPGDYQDSKNGNLLFIINDDKIVLDYGVLSPWQKRQLLKKFNKAKT